MKGLDPDPDVKILASVFANFGTKKHKPVSELTLISEKMSEISKNIAILKSIGQPVRKLKLRPKINKRRASTLFFTQNSSRKNLNKSSIRAVRDMQPIQINNPLNKKNDKNKLPNSFSKKKLKPKNSPIYLTEINLPDINSPSILRNYSNLASEILNEDENQSNDHTLNYHLPCINKNGLETAGNENNNSKSIGSSRDSISSNRKKLRNKIVNYFLKKNNDNSFKDFEKKNTKLCNRINSSRFQMSFYKQVFLAKWRFKYDKYFIDVENEKKERKKQLFRDLNDLTKNTKYYDQYPFCNSMEELVKNLEYNIQNKKYKDDDAHQLYKPKESLILDNEDFLRNKSQYLSRSLHQIVGRIRRQNEIGRKIKDIMDQNQRSLSNINSYLDQTNV